MQRKQRRLCFIIHVILLWEKYKFLNINIFPAGNRVFVALAWEFKIKDFKYIHKNLCLLHTSRVQTQMSVLTHIWKMLYSVYFHSYDSHDMWSVIHLSVLSSSWRYRHWTMHLNFLFENMFVLKTLTTHNAL